MSDFLTNLAARTLQTAAVVQPRLAARFETIPPVDHSPMMDDPFGREVEAATEPPAPPSPALPTSQTALESGAGSEINSDRSNKFATNLRPLPAARSAR